MINKSGALAALMMVLLPMRIQAQTPLATGQLHILGVQLVLGRIADADL